MRVSGPSFHQGLGREGSEPTGGQIAILAAQGPLGMFALDAKLLMRPKLFSVLLQRTGLFSSPKSSVSLHIVSYLPKACLWREILAPQPQPTHPLFLPPEMGMNTLFAVLTTPMEKQGLIAVICEPAWQVCIPGCASGTPHGPTVSGSLLSSQPCALEPDPCHFHIPSSPQPPPLWPHPLWIPSSSQTPHF